MIEKLIDASGGKLLIPILLALMFGALIRAIFSLHRTRSADRRDFLELWAKNSERDDLWLEVSVRHLFGTYLPASLIRSLLQCPQAGRALLDVSEFWPLLEFDDETLGLKWKKAAYASHRKRTRMLLLFNVLYSASTAPGIYVGYVALKGGASPAMTFNFYVYGLFLIGVGFYFLSRAEVLKTAHAGGPRWLSLP